MTQAEHLLTIMEKLQKGDTVKLSKLASEKKFFKHKTGIICGPVSDKSDTIRIQHPGLKYPYTYHKDYWEKNDPSQTPPQSV